METCDTPVIVLWHSLKLSPNLVLCCLHNSKTRENLESKSSFNFLQNIAILCVLYPGGYMAGDSALYNPRGGSQRLAGLI